MKKFPFLFLSTVLILLLLASCGSNSKERVRAPFGTSDYQGLPLEDVMSQLEDAGFTSIETKSMLTYSETKDGTVGTVTIDGSTLFLDGSTYSPDVPVVVKYYAMLEETEPDTSEEETPQAAETESEPIYTADASSIKQLAEDKFSFDYADLTVEWDDTDEAFVVSFYPTATPLDESTWVYQSINRYIKFCQFAYNIDGLERIRFDISASGTDQRGNEVTFLGLSVLMSRENFALYDWDNLSYMGI